MITNEKALNYITKRNLVNRVFDMLEYLDFLKHIDWSDEEILNYLTENLQDVYFVETLAKYFEVKLKKKKYKNKIELKCNLKKLIDDLNYIKQYLDDETCNFL